MAWRITFDGEVFDKKDYTGDQAERAADRAQVRWILHPLASVKEYQALLAVLLADRRNISEDEAHKFVKSHSESVLVAAFEAVDDDIPTEFVDGFPPEAGDQKSTPGSSGAPATSTGPPTSSDANG